MGEEDNPFDAAVQKDVTTRRARMETAAGRQIAVYDYTQQTKEALWRG